ncbi:hypothetical protein D3C75_1055860 [compost metagenome]
MEAEAADMADGPQGFAFIGRHHALRSILYHHQVVLLRQRHDGVHFAGYASVMHRHDGTGFIGDRRFNLGFIDVHGVWTQIDKHHHRPAQHKGVSGGYEGVARHDHFITRLDIQQDGGHFQ